MTHKAQNVQFDVFVNRIMYSRPARVWAGPMGLCFSWQGRNGQTFGAFRRGNDVVFYRAMDAVWATGHKNAKGIRPPMTY